MLIAGVIFATGSVIRLARSPEIPAAQWADIFPDGAWRLLFWATVGAGLVALSTLLVGSLSLNRKKRADLGSAAINSPLHETLSELREAIAEDVAAHEPDIPQILDRILRSAIILGASDIHFNPGETTLQVNYRVDGLLYDVVSFSGQIVKRLVTRIKVLSHLDHYSREPQDGSMRRRVVDVNIEARVSTLPANHGERVVMRLVRSGESVPTLRELGFQREVCSLLEDLLQKPEGMIYVSGPVGSGKTTTMYSALQHIHQTRGDTTALVSLEDPIEMQLPFATQTQINSRVGLGFAAALRSVLRQDPGALMLGEIRDRETAEIATQAGLTGHLILTTLHVQSAAATFDRLIEMDVERFVLASSCLGSLAQRLVRSLCVECRKAHPPPIDVVERFAALGVRLTAQTYFEPQGCPACEGRGYLGRLPVAELLVMSEAIRALLQRGATRDEIQETAVKEGMIPILKSAMAHAEKGRTSLHEVLRVAG